jgi:hypothetical protein
MYLLVPVVTRNCGTSKQRVGRFLQKVLPHFCGDALFESKETSKRAEETLLSYSNMARKKAQKAKSETTLVPHRTPNLSDLLARAESGASALAVKAYLDAGGSTDVLVNSGDAVAMQQLPLLHHMVLFSSQAAS